MIKIKNNTSVIAVVMAAAFLVSGFFVANSPAFAVTANITKINFTTLEQTINTNTVSAQLTTQTQEVGGASEQVSETTTLNLSSTSETGEFSFNADNWIPVTTLTMSNPSANRNFYYRDSVAGTYTLTVAAQGKTWTAATQTIIVTVSAIANVANLTQLQAALADANIATINITAPIATTERLLLNHPATINGNGNAITFTGVTT